MTIDKPFISEILPEDPNKGGKGMDRASLYEAVTKRIVRELEAGVAPWVKPWSVRGFAGLPVNLISGRAYSGVNVLTLWLEGMERGFKHPGWLTFKQAKELGGSVMKGEKGVRIVYASSYLKTETDETGEESERTISYLKSYTVFNVEQTQGLPEPCYQQPKSKPLAEANEDAERFLQASGAEIRHGGKRAFYQATYDYIRLPQPQDFTESSAYYATALHELVHWTGHPSRLSRDLSGRFGSDAYAAEELVAELAGAFLCAHLEIPGKLQHAEYLAHWLKLLKADARAIFSAARLATEAAEYLKVKAEAARAAA